MIINDVKFFQNTKKTVLFDLDGTLLNTLDDITHCVNLTLLHFNLKEMAKEDVKNCIGDGIITLIKRIMPNSDDVKLQEACLYYKFLYNKHKFEITKPYDGIIHMLCELKARDIKIGIVTNKKEEVAAELVNYFFEGLIDITVGDDFIRPLKPNPAPIFYALEMLYTDAAQAIFVGDSEMDILAAKNASVHSVGVTYGYRDSSVLLEHKPNILIDTPARLLEYIIES